MRISKKYYFALFLLAALAGFALHSLYRAVPVWPVALLAPVRESLWEHLKLLFWPYLAVSLFLSVRYGRSVRPRLLTLLLICAVLLGLSFWYHILLGGESVVVDICLYLFLMVVGFVLPHFLRGPYTGRGWSLILPLTVLLAGLILLFTFFPPDNLLFVDLSGADTWSRIPC